VRFAEVRLVLGDLREPPEVFVEELQLWLTKPRVLPVVAVAHDENRSSFSLVP
jgi:hypothetical protein